MTCMLIVAGKLPRKAVVKLDDGFSGEGNAVAQLDELVAVLTKCAALHHQLAARGE